MAIFNLKLLHDYINCMITNEEENDNLENNVEYMKAVIIDSNDFRMYRFCSDEVKKNYEFVKFFIYTFKDKINNNRELSDLLNEVAKYYLENSDEETNKFELSIIMSDLTGDYIDYNLQYKLKSFARYNVIDMYHSLVSEELDSEYLKNCYGMGFISAEENYGSSEIVLDYIAKRMVNDICIRNIKNLEIELHKCFKSANDVRNYGLNNIMIDYVARFDYKLSIYLQTRTELLKPLKSGLEDILINWQVHNLKIDDIKMEKIISIYDEYYPNMEIKELYTKYDLLQYIARKIRISHVLGEYLESEDYIYVGEDDKEFDEYICNQIYSSETNAVRYNKLFSAIKRIKDSLDPKVIDSIRISECEITRLRKAM